LRKKTILSGLQFLVGVGISIVGLKIFFQDVDLERLSAALRDGNVFFYIVSATLSIISLYLRSLRWRVMLPDIKGTSKKHLFPYVSIGFMVNNILPARAGEAVRILLLWKKNGYKPAVAIGAFFLERIIDLFIFLSFFFIPVFFIPGLAQFKSLSLVMIAAFLAFIIFLTFFAHFPQGCTRILLLFTRILPHGIRHVVSDITHQLLSNLDWLRSPRRVLEVIVLSYANSLCFALVMFLLAHPALHFIEALFAQAYAAFGAAIPLSPGFVGTQHAVLLQGLTALGVEVESARALTIIYHAITFSTLTISGLLFFFKTDISFKQISEAADTIKENQEREQYD